MRIVALGATGNAGRAITTLLGPDLAASDELVLTGRNAGRLAKARDAASSPAAISTTLVDLDAPAQVRAALDGADLVIVTVSRPDLVATLARATLAAGTDWFDTLLSGPTKLDALHALAPQIAAEGRCFVTDGGFHPGLPGVLVHWAAEQLDELTTADVMAGMRIDWLVDTLADSTVGEMLDEFADFDLSTWIDGGRRTLRWSECPTVDFGEPIGIKQVAPMRLAEMLDLPERYPGLQRCGFYICGFGPAMDFLALPLIMVLGRIRALRPATIRLTRWSMGRLASSPPPHRLVVQTEAKGLLAGRPATASVRVGGSDPYLLTAAPAVACLRRLLDGSARQPGLHYQANVVPPEAFLADLAELGLSVETSID